MKVLAVLGSPRKDNTFTLVNEITKALKEEGHEVLSYNISNMNIKGCQACEGCRKGNTDCIQNDDLLQSGYWKELHNADALILSSPNYCGNLCGPMITFMNRHYCIFDKDYNVRIPEGIKLIGVFSQGYEDKNAYIEEYKKYLKDFQARKMKLVDIIVHSGKIAAKDDKELLTKAYDLGKKLFCQ